MTKPLTEIIVLVSHGSRIAEAKSRFLGMVNRLKHDLSHHKLVAAFVEIDQPNMWDVIQDEAPYGLPIRVIPVMLFNSGHVKNDLAIAIEGAKSKYPQTPITLSPAIGSSHLICNYYHSLLDDPAENRDKQAILIVGRGSSDINSNSEFSSITRKIGEACGFKWIFNSFVGIASPVFDETLEKIIQLRFKKVFILPYFLNPGILEKRVHQHIGELKVKFPWINFKILPILSDSSLLDDVIKEKIQAKKPVPMDCVNCQYRVPIGKLKQKVGGLNTLLWSMRHMETHRQATPNEHSHKPIKKHLLICTNHDCAHRGSIDILHEIRRGLRRRGMSKEFKVTRTSCMGKCGEGPTLAVYPDGIWYRDFSKNDINALIDGHFIKDRLVKERVDLIM